MAYVQLFCNEYTHFGYKSQYIHTNTSYSTYQQQGLIKAELKIKNKNTIVVDKKSNFQEMLSELNSHVVYIMLISDNKILIRKKFNDDDKDKKQNSFLCHFSDNVIVIENKFENTYKAGKAANEIELKNIEIIEIDRTKQYVEPYEYSIKIRKLLKNSRTLKDVVYESMLSWIDYVQWMKKKTEDESFYLRGTVNIEKNISKCYIKIPHANNDNTDKIEKMSILIDRHNDEYDSSLDEKPICVRYQKLKTSKKETYIYWDELMSYGYKNNETVRLTFKNIGTLKQCERFENSIRKLEALNSIESINLASWLFDIKNSRDNVDIWHDKNLNFKNDKMNDEQKEAVKKIIDTQDVLFILGPPGTGKTTVIAEAINQITLSGKTVLLSSQSNDAIDNALGRLNNDINIRALRAGRKISCDDPYGINNYEWNISNNLENLIKEAIKSGESSIKNNKKYIDIYNKSKPFFDYYIKHIEIFEENNVDTDSYYKCWKKYGDNFKELWRDEYKDAFREIWSIYCQKNFTEKYQSWRYFFRQCFENKELPKGIGLFMDRINKVQLLEPKIAALKSVLNILNKNNIQKENDVKTFSADYNKFFVENMLKTINVFSITCNSDIDSQEAKFFDSSSKIYDYAIIDEVSKATLPEILNCMLKAKHIVMVGDHRQLPPVFSADDDSVKKYGKEKMYAYKDLITNTIFKELYDKAPSYSKCMLTKQYRMHNDIANIITSNFYKDKDNKTLLQNGLSDERSDNEKKHSVEYKNIFSKSNHVYWVNSSPKNGGCYETQCGTSKCNHYEIDIISAIVKIIDKNTKEKTSVGVISFYGAQNKMLKQELKNESLKKIELDVDTVDRFQGQERNIIIVSLVRSVPKNKIKKYKNNSFFRAYERLNVAFSRAQAMLIIVGAVDFCEQQTITIKPLSINEESVIDDEVLYEKHIYADIITNIKNHDCLIDGSVFLNG